MLKSKLLDIVFISNGEPYAEFNYEHLKRAVQMEGLDCNHIHHSKGVNGRVAAYDGMFFHKGQPFNQGNIYDFNEEEFIVACENVTTKVQKNKVNEVGLALQETFSKDKFASNVIEILK